MTTVSAYTGTLLGSKYRLTVGVVSKYRMWVWFLNIDWGCGFNIVLLQHPVVDEDIAPVERETELVDNGGSQIHEQTEDMQQSRQEDQLEDRQNHRQEEATSFMEPHNTVES